MFKKLLISAIVLLSFNQDLKSQQTKVPRNPKLGIGAAAILGNNEYGLGYSLNFQSAINSVLNWTATVEKTNLQSTLKVMPQPKFENLVAKAGAKYYLSKQFYFSGETGLAFDQLRTNHRSLAWSTGIGVETNVFGKSSIELGGKYEQYRSKIPLSFFALKATFNLGF